MQIGVRIEESWSLFRPYRWLAERPFGRTRRKLIHRESFRASVLHHSDAQAVRDHCMGILRLDNAFVLIERHPTPESQSQFLRLSHPPASLFGSDRRIAKSSHKKVAPFSWAQHRTPGVGA